MQKQRSTYSPLSILERLIPGAQNAIVCRPRKIKKTPSRSIAIKFPKIENKLSLISFLLLISLKTPKKRDGSRQKDRSATGVSVTNVVKKEKDKTKDLSHIKCYTCKQKHHNANKYLDKPKI